MAMTFRFFFFTRHFGHKDMVLFGRDCEAYARLITFRKKVELQSEYICRLFNLWRTVVILYQRWPLHYAGIKQIFLSFPLMSCVIISPFTLHFLVFSHIALLYAHFLPAPVIIYPSALRDELFVDVYYFDDVLATEQCKIFYFVGVNTTLCWINHHQSEKTVVSVATSMLVVPVKD